MSQYKIPVSPGKYFILDVDPMTTAEWQQFMAVLETFKPGLVKPEEPLEHWTDLDDIDVCGWVSRTPGWLPCDLSRDHEGAHHLLSAKEVSGVRLSHTEDSPSTAHPGEKRITKLSEPDRCSMVWSGFRCTQPANVEHDHHYPPDEAP